MLFSLLFGIEFCKQRLFCSSSSFLHLSGYGFIKMNYNFLNVLLFLFLQGPDHQTILFNHGAVQNIAHLLTSLSYKVRC